MASSSHHNQQSSSSKHNPRQSFLSLPPPKNPSTSSDTDEKNPNPNAITAPISESTAAPFTPPAIDTYLSEATHLTRQEVIMRRSHRLKQLTKCYRDHYWGLMEELRTQYRDYVWRYGTTPYEEDDHEKDAAAAANNNGSAIGDGIVEGSGETNANGSSNHNNSNNNNLLCAFYGCKLKAMALTSFCQLHILSDSKQQLYKPCGYVIKSAQAGNITCGKPILQSAVPSLCGVHFQKAQKHVNRALRKAGLNGSSSSKLAPKFHVIVAEYVREIQGKRKAALRANRNKAVINHEHGG